RRHRPSGAWWKRVMAQRGEVPMEEYSDKGTVKNEKISNYGRMLQCCTALERPGKPSRQIHKDCPGNDRTLGPKTSCRRTGELHYRWNRLTAIGRHRVV